MKQLSSIFFILILTSCGSNYKIYVNGQFSHEADKLCSYTTSTNDSCIILDEKHVLPDSISFINEMRIKYGYATDSFPLFSTDFSLFEMAKTQAKVFHADVVKVSDLEKHSWFRLDELVVKLYYLKEPYWSVLKKQIDSLAYVNSGFKNVHLKPINLYLGKQKLPIYVNDSIVAYCPKNNSILGLNVTLKGVLSLRKSGMTKYHHNNRFSIDIDRDQQYYIHIYEAKNGVRSLEGVTKDEF